MLPSFLTTICFSLSIIFAARSARLLGSAKANLTRMTVALGLLAAWAFLFGQGLQGPGIVWFLLSGLIGFGLGDAALFLSLSRIGPRMTILLVQCLAVPFGVAIERIWLGTVLSTSQLLCGAVILTGVAIALAPSGTLHLPRSVIVSGTIFGTLAAVGQALGAVISRKGYEVHAAVMDLPLDGGTAAFQRMLGGIAFTAAFAGAVKYWQRRPAPTAPTPRIAWLWVTLNALAGPTLGVACYQWALSGTPTGIVLPIVATTPVVTIPFAFWLEGDVPSARSILGGIIAVSGAAALTAV